MSYRYQKNPISGEQEMIIDGFEKGIADSPYVGAQDIRNMNLISSPYQASVNFSMDGMTIPPTVSAVSWSAVGSTDVFTVSDTTGWYNAMAITVNSSSGGGVSTGRVYWVGDLSGATFKLYKNPSLVSGQLLDVTADATGTLSSYTLSQPKYATTDFKGAQTSPTYYYQFLIDSAGRVWWIYNKGGTTTNNLVYIGNDTLTNASGNGIAIFHGYILVFRDSTIDYLQASKIDTINGNTDLDTGSGWVYGWQSVDTQANHQAITAQDDAVYWCNSGRVGSLLEVVGETFDPTDSGTYVKNSNALDIPDGDTPTYIAELGTNLLIGGIRNYVYPWDRVSTSFSYPIILAESYTTRIVTSNSSSYIFAGTRGRIYITNGSNVDLFKKIPDGMVGYQDPYFTWKDASYWRNQLYFSFTVSDNAGNALNSTSGLWAIDLSSGVFRYTNQLSYGTYQGTTSLIFPNYLSLTPEGNGLYAGWVDGSSNPGLDIASSDPYSNSESYIVTEIIPVGDFLHQRTFNNFEFKLGRPMVSGESISLYQRENLTDSFTLIGTTTTTTLSDKYDSNFQNVQWVQFKIITSSTDTTPSYVPLRQLIIR